MEGRIEKRGSSLALPSDRRALLSERLEQASCSVLAFMSFLSLRKQPTSRDATSSFPKKKRLTNERRN